MARATVRPPTPESMTPVGASRAMSLAVKCDSPGPARAGPQPGEEPAEDQEHACGHHDPEDTPREDGPGDEVAQPPEDQPARPDDRGVRPDDPRGQAATNHDHQCGEEEVSQAADEYHPAHD